MTSAIIVAAGSSRRMGFNKLLAPLAGVPVLHRTLGQFQACVEVGEILVVAGDEVRAVVEAWRAEFPKLKAILPGGAERHLSVWAGLQACTAESDVVAVHDGARPLIHPEQITRCIEAARRLAAVACARPMTETIKRVDAEGHITGSLDRTGVWVMETPQVFQRDVLVRAYEAVIRDSALVTDEVSAVQHVGEVVSVVENTSPNPKITFPADLTLAEKFL
ncbi:2-C-methyl-D-erythritol 4-phosphate cytidylyltransferase [Prosthecobacter dejongeii]|uniref:2-C-methyl-D-erythritol 4-phosphate cytidylyltransferase n=1 Tax=Prosthecobacter dejongeii TaxID=48465 RepID=A0A7W7YKY2_9BACT|nr:2-C-methyl-D-erythritol 4-phosphate cytidylyltransferase [Prosthecobacter dejongeii]MBB5037845.1 2-C-methyl-D-erythritol 4-phosphate cytidylyltransferase [Prosthecobacter dejongeii]